MDAVAVALIGVGLYLLWSALHNEHPVINAKAAVGTSAPAGTIVA